MSTVRLAMVVFFAALLGGPRPAHASDSPVPDASVPASSPSAAPLPPASVPPADGAVPGPPPAAYPYPPYPAPSGYPSGYAYPPPTYPAYPPGYGQYPPSYPPYPAYPAPPPPEAPPPPPAPVPTGRLRLGGSFLFIPEGSSPYHASYLSYDLRVRGETLFAHKGDIETTAGVAVFAELDLIRYLHLALAVQLQPSIRWRSTTTTTMTQRDPFVGTGHEVDFFPQVGVTFSATRRLRVLGYIAPGYALLAAAGMADVLANSGTPHGFALQVGSGILYAIGQHGFFTVRVAQQWAFLQSQAHSNTTGETAEAYFRLRFLALHNSIGFWF